MNSCILYLSTLYSSQMCHKVFESSGSLTSYSGQRFGQMLVDGLSKNGKKITIVSPVVEYYPNPQRFSDIEKDIEYIYLPKKRKGILQRLLYIYYAYIEIMKWHGSNKQGIVLCDILNGELSLALALYRSFHGIKSVAVVTDVPIKRADDKRSGIQNAPVIIKQALLKHYDAYVFLTEAMNSLINTKNRPYVVVEGFVKNDEIPQNDLYDKSIRRCMMAGLLEKAYGVDMLVDAFLGIDMDNIEMLFYGKGSSVEYIKNASITNHRIKYCGELPNAEILKLEKEASLLINPRPATEEWTLYSFPSKNLEYMASGTPLVCFEIECIPEEYKTYYYRFEKPEPESMRMTLEKLLSKTEDELRAYGERAKEWVFENKNNVAQTNRIIKMLDKLQ